MQGWRRKGRTQGLQPALPRPAVRVLRDEAELASASERAAEGERRLRARLEARAARDAWTAEHRQAPGVDVAPGMTLPAGAPSPRPRSVPGTPPVAPQIPGTEPGDTARSPRIPAA